MFKPGDKVKKKELVWVGLGSYPILDKNPILTVKGYTSHEVYPTVTFNETGNHHWDAKFFIHVNPLEDIEMTPQDIQGIAKPILEERKIGKVKMHLVDEGFPNAMMELGKMMGWAEDYKGYKPNDFKNLPNAEVEFSAAATRHRLKGFIQKAEGVSAIDRVDEESGISHLCHAAFNILAELELVLTGRIK